MLAEQVVVIAGVGPGLGREVAARCLADGASVVVAARSGDKLSELAADLDAGDRILAVPTDICEADACDALVASTLERFGRLDGVALVAAHTPMGPAMDSDLDAWRTAFDVNVIGSVQTVRSAADALADGDGGRVVLIGSQSSMLPQPEIPQAGYAASKGALSTALYFLAQELGPRGVTVNCVVPSWMWGPNVQMYCDWKASERGLTRDDIAAEIAEGIPTGSIVPDEEVAKAVGFFLSDRSKMITGQHLLVNGGELMH